MNTRELVYGTSETPNIVACEYIQDDQMEVFSEAAGIVSSRVVTSPLFLVSDEPLRDSMELAGDLPLKYLTTYTNKRDYWDDRKRAKNILKISDDREAAMIRSGFTFFKGMSPKDISILSFDIETTGLTHDETSKVLLISNTYRINGQVGRVLFSYDDFDTQAEMLDAWSVWIRMKDPSIICGHNVYSFDFPYLEYCARMNGTTLRMGRDGSQLSINRKWKKKFRYDQSNFYEFEDVSIYGRNIVDTFFLSLRYDFVEKRYSSYALKNIIKQEGLEQEGRVFYDGSKIRLHYKDPVEWEKIKQYAERDADDSLALYDLMIPAYFYLTQSVPKTFQNVMTSASGGQINSMLVRGYIQNEHSLPLPSESGEFEGAISIGNPGVYQNVFKVDVASLYPSIMLEYKVSDKTKDPLAVLPEILEYLTTERLSNKKLAKTNPTLKALSDAQKIIINSFYGFLGTQGLNFNSPENAALVTRHGREILEKAIALATRWQFNIVNADTDSISVVSSNPRLVEPWTQSDRDRFIKYLNDEFPSRIRWEDDGVYERVLVLKIKNYVLDQNGKRTIKGSALKATPKESALRDFIKDTIDTLITGNSDKIPALYNQYVKEILTISDINRWSAKKTITSSVLSATTTTGQKVLSAVESIDVAQGDKVFVYFTENDTLSLAQEWNPENPNHDIDRLFEKLYKTLKIFKPVYNIDSCLNYSLKRNKKFLSLL